MTEREPIVAGPPLTVAQVVSDVFREQRKALKRHAKRCADQADVEAVHQARVATRRLRAALRVFRGHINEPPGVPRRLRWIARRLGAVRDGDVIAGLLAGRHVPALEGTEKESAEALLRSLARRRRKAHRALMAALGQDRFEKLMASLRDFAQDPRALDEDTPAGRVLVEAAQRLGTAVEQERGMLERSPSPEALHSLRIAFKRLRYALDFHAAACGVAFETERALARTMQDVLGEVHDHDLLSEWLAAGRGSFAGPWPTLRDRLAADRKALYRRFLRLRRKWEKRNPEPATMAPLSEPRFANLEPARVSLRLVTTPKHVASTSTG